MLSAPVLDEQALEELHAIAMRAFEKGKEIRDAALMEECVTLMVAISRRLDAMRIEAIRASAAPTPASTPT
mgnify:FL=1